MQSVQLHNRAVVDGLCKNFEDVSHILSQTIVPSDILRTFVAIYECGSFTKVARALQLTQPAISAQMKKLESLVGATLILRNAPGIALTARGHEVLTAARRMLSINSQILTDSSQSAPTIRIGVPNIFAPQLLAALSANGRGPVTNARIQLFCDHSRSLYQNVQSGSLEMACVIGEDVDHSEALVSWTEEFVWMCASQVTIGTHEVVPLICSPNRILPDRLAIEALRRSSRKFEVAFSSFDWVARESAARSGLGYLACSKRLAVAALTMEHGATLPSLRNVKAAIVTGDGVDAQEIATIAAVIRAALHVPSTVEDI